MSDDKQSAQASATKWRDVYPVIQWGDALLPSRFWRKCVVNESECWIWQASANRGGYGQFWSEFGCLAHRFSYSVCIEDIPRDLVLDHLCRNRNCVNPEHLEPVTHRENVMRGMSPIVAAIERLSITHCPRGHEYSASNTRMHHGSRECRACDAGRQRDRRRRIRESLSEQKEIA